MNCIKCNKEIFRTPNRKYCDRCKEERSRGNHRKNYQEHIEERREYQKQYAKARGISRCIDRDRKVGYRFIKRELKRILHAGEFYEEQSMGMDLNDKSYATVYLGCFLSLDPCGKYHHILSPNGVTKTCEKFWENLNQAAEDLGGWIESGKGNETDIFFCFSKSTYYSKIKNHNTYLKRKEKSNAK